LKDLFVQLTDRTLRFDGVSILHPEKVQDFLLHGLFPSQIRVTELTPEINHFNTHVPAEDRLKAPDTAAINFDLTWKLPAEYAALDIQERVLQVFEDRLPDLNYSAEEIEQAISRVDTELQEYTARGLLDLLRVIIFVLDTFKETGQVYGVGRGSSCASFILFLLGLHVVDSIKFNVPLQEFFHD
jgi:DNA polymerase III alpha subunit